MSRAPLLVAGIIFALVALLHLARLYFQFPITFNEMPVPLWANAAGLVISSGLSIWMFCSLKKV